MGMKSLLACIYIVSLTTLLAACGSSADESEIIDDALIDHSPVSEITADTAMATYTGLRTAAALDQQNTETFMQLFFNLKTLHDAMAAPDVSGLNQTTNCANGGSLLLSGAVSGTGASPLTANFMNCDQGTSIINGVTYITVNALDESLSPSDMVVSYQALSVQTGGRSFILTGVETYLKQGFSETTVINATIEENGSQMFIENMTTNEVSFSENPAEEGELFTGRLYLANEGYVDITTQDRIAFELNVVGEYPVDGQMTMTGDNSNVLLSPLGWAGSFQAYLDQDGDGIADLIATQGTQPMELIWNAAE